MATHGRHTPTSRRGSTLTEKISSVEISRRQLIIGAAVAGVGIAAASGAYYVVDKDSSVGTTRLSVSSSNVFGLDNCEQIDDIGQYLKLSRTITLPYNSIVKYGGDNIIATLQTSGEGTPLNKAIIIDASTANVTNSLTAAVSSEPRWDIIDFCASKSGCVWIEANLLTDKKRVFTSNSHNAKENPQKVLELDSNWKIPTIVASKNVAWIQIEPNSSDTTTRSELLKISLGSSANSIEQVLTTRAFACQPTLTNGGICCAPRDNVYSSSYKLTYIDNNANTVDCCTLPTSMLPQDVAYSNSHFAFSFAGSYDYGDGISQIGTYSSLSSDSTFEELERSEKSKTDNAETASNKAKDSRNTLLSSSTWMQFGRTPLSAPAWIGELYAVKSTRTVAVFRPESRQYALIEASDGADDYGVWMCNTGESDKLITITNIDYTPLKGDLVKECRLQVWETV